MVDGWVKVFNGEIGERWVWTGCWLAISVGHLENAQDVVERVQKVIWEPPWCHDWSLVRVVPPKDIYICICISVCQNGVSLEDTTMNKPHLFVQQSVVVSIVQSHNFYIIDILTDTSLFKRQAIIGSRPFDVVAVVLYWSIQWFRICLDSHSVL